MTFEEFKIELEKWIAERYGEKRAKWEMELYEEELPELYKEGWSIEGLGSAMVFGL